MSLPPRPQITLQHDAGRALIRGRNYVRSVGLDAAVAALKRALRPWSGKFRITWWGRGQTSTGTVDCPGRGHVAEHDIEMHARWHRQGAPAVRAKGRGRSISHGVSRYLGSSDAECLERTMIFCDSDARGPWQPLIAVLDEIDAAYVASRRLTADKFHIEIPLAVPVAITTPNDQTFKERHRQEYGWILGVLSEVGQLACDYQNEKGHDSVSCLGLDAKIPDRFLCLGNPYTRREPGDPIPETIHRVGLAFDWASLLSETGYTFEDWRCWRTRRSA